MKKVVKIGDIWIADPAYLFGRCVVEIMYKYPAPKNRWSCYVLDCEEKRIFGDEIIEFEWVFYGKELKEKVGEVRYNESSI